MLNYQAAPVHVQARARGAQESKAAFMGSDATDIIWQIWQTFKVAKGSASAVIEAAEPKLLELKSADIPLEEKFDKLKDLLHKVMAAIRQEHGAIDGLDERFHELLDAINGMQDEIDSLKTKVAALQAKTKNMDQTQTQTQAEVDSHADELKLLMEDLEIRRAEIFMGEGAFVLAQLLQKWIFKVRWYTMHAYQNKHCAL